MPIFIPDLFTSYINGRRQAVADNWQDLSNYNHILAGQLNNAFNMATFDPRVRSAEATAQITEQNNATNANLTDQNIALMNYQNKYNVPQQKALAESSTYALQQAQTSALLDYLKKNPSAAALFFPGLTLNGQPGQYVQNGKINTGLNVQNGYGLNGESANANANANANAQQPSSTNAGK